MVCVPTGQKYCGSTVNLKNRKSQHFSRLKHNKHRNTHIQEAYRRYGREAFVFEVLELVPEVRLKEVEQRYLDSGEYELNISLRSGGGAGIDNHPNRDAITSKMSAARTGKKASKESRAKTSAAMVGRFIGEDSTRFIGYFQTPWGDFPSSTAAAEESGGLMVFSSVYKFCMNPDIEISKLSFRKSKFLRRNYDHSVIGRTYRSLGFSFKPAN